MNPSILNWAGVVEVFTCRYGIVILATVALLTTLGVLLLLNKTKIVSTFILHKTHSSVQKIIGLALILLAGSGLFGAKALWFGVLVFQKVHIVLFPILFIAIISSIVIITIFMLGVSLILRNSLTYKFADSFINIKNSTRIVLGAIFIIVDAFIITYTLWFLTHLQL